MQKEQALLCSQTEKDKVRMQKKEAGLLKNGTVTPGGQYNQGHSYSPRLGKIY